MRGAYRSYYMKNLCEDQMFGYDALALEKCFIVVINCSVCDVYRIGNYDPCDYH